MGRTKDLWVAEIDHICELYANGTLAHDAAMLELVLIGLNQYEAEENLAAAAESLNLHAEK